MSHGVGDWKGYGTAIAESLEGGVVFVGIESDGIEDGIGVCASHLVSGD